MERRKSVRFLLPIEPPINHPCEFHREGKELNQACSDRHPTLVPGRPPRPPPAKSAVIKNETADYVCLKHRKQKSRPTVKPFARTKNKDLSGHVVDGERRDKPLVNVCPHGARSQSASPQLSRRLVKSHPADDFTRRSALSYQTDDSKIAALQWDAREKIPCVHLNSEIQRQRSGFPSSNHYSDARCLRDVKTTSSKKPSDQRSNYYFLPPRDPMLTSFIESDGVLKCEVNWMPSLHPNT